MNFFTELILKNTINKWVNSMEWWLIFVLVFFLICCCACCGAFKRQ